MPKDEILIQLRESMSESDLITELESVSTALHRMIQISISGGAKAHLVFFTHLVNAAGATESAAFMLKQTQNQNSAIVRPQ